MKSIHKNKIDECPSLISFYLKGFNWIKFDALLMAPKIIPTLAETLQELNRAAELFSTSYLLLKRSNKPVRRINAIVKPLSHLTRVKSQIQSRKYGACCTQSEDQSHGALCHRNQHEWLPWHGLNKREITMELIIVVKTKRLLISANTRDSTSATWPFSLLCKLHSFSCQFWTQSWG